MIQELHIRNYALIDRLDIEFSDGLNIITGETGAGKSIMLGALSLLLGARADSRAVRQADAKSVVEAHFAVSGNDALRQLFTAEDFDWDPQLCILRREVSPAGRSRAFINDQPVSLTVLQQVGERLIDIHSQHQNQLLSSPEWQLDILDSLASNAEVRQQYQSLFRTLREAEKRLTDTEAEIESARADQEFIRFQLDQLDAAAPVPGEQEELERERELLANITAVRRSLTDAIDYLTDGDASVSTQLSGAVDCCEDLEEVMDGTKELAQRLESARVEIQDVAETLQDFLGNLSGDPADLEAVEERLDALYSLQRRFRVDTVEQLIELQKDMRARLNRVEDSDVLLADLRAEVTKARKVAEASASELTKRRQAAAAEFAAELLAAARPLGMPNLRFEVEFTPCKLSPVGSAQPEFRFAFNKNQPLASVGGMASGGEISRLMLSVKSIVAGRLQLPTIVFDEVDTGVSGDVALRMGAMMDAIAGHMQVITITHLPQVAAKGVSHFKVFKEDDDSATHTRIRRLTAAERVDELALMLSGSPTDPAARATAASLLNSKP